MHSDDHAPALTDQRGERPMETSCSSELGGESAANEIPFDEGDLTAYSDRSAKLLAASEAKLAVEWYRALYEEDSLRLMALLDEYDNLKLRKRGWGMELDRLGKKEVELWERGWVAEPHRLVKGRRENYWKEEEESKWMGRNALHVGVRRGCVPLLQRVLQRVLQLSQSERKRTLEGLLRAKDGEYQLNAIAMAIVNGNQQVVALLLHAGHKCSLVKTYGIEMRSEERKILNVAEDNRHREKLKAITKEVVASFEEDPYFRTAVLRRYSLHRDFNFLPREEYLFHFLFTTVGWTEATKLLELMDEGGQEWKRNSSNRNYSIQDLIQRMNVLVLTEIAERASESPGLLEYLWAMQDGQGRPPLHIAVEEEPFEHVLRCKALTLTRAAISVDEKILKKIIHARDGAGRTALHRAVALGDPNFQLETLLEDVDENVIENVIDDDIWTVNFRDLERKYTAGTFNEMRRKAAAKEFWNCLEDTEYGFDSRSVWRASEGAEYYIDLHLLFKWHGFSAKLWSGCAPIHSAILQQDNDLLACIIKVSKTKQASYIDRDIEAIKTTALGSRNTTERVRLDSVGLAVFLGNEEAVKILLTHRRNKNKNTQERTRLDFIGPALFRRKAEAAKMLPNHPEGSGRVKQDRVKLDTRISPLFLAAARGRCNMLVSLIEAGYSIQETDFLGNTALHHATSGMSIVKEVLRFGIGLPAFVNCQEIFQGRVDIKGWNKEKRMLENLTTKEFLNGESLLERQACIDLLIRSGCDVLKANKKGEVACPCVHSNPDFVSWWHPKQTKEFADAQSAQNMAANAISVTAALVATASYVGPLQPPLGYGGDPPQLQLYILAVQVFIVCDTLSFYLAIASIISALAPCLPMPQLPLTEELSRTRRMVNFAVALLFPSIICVLLAFAAGSVAVIQTNHTVWNRGLLTIGTAAFGGLICVIVIAMFLIRVLAIIFHETPFFKTLYKLIWF